MHFTSTSESDGFDFTEYSVPELRTAVKLASGFTLQGALDNTERARKLGAALKQAGKSSACITYIMGAGKSQSRVITPFNVQTQLAERNQTYKCTAVETTVGKSRFPTLAGFLSYKGKQPEIEELLPKTTVIPFDGAYAMNVAYVAAVTKYVCQKGEGMVEPVASTGSLYIDTPVGGMALAALFKGGLGSSVTMVGAEWAHFLYHKFWQDKQKFMFSVAKSVEVPPGLCVGTPRRWTKTYNPRKWGMNIPETDVQKIEELNKLQAYRSKDNAGISAMTYAVYGEEFGGEYRMAEKLANFTIFFDYARGLKLQTKSIRYVSSDQRELTIMSRVMQNYGYNLIHHLGVELDGIPHSKTSRHTYKGQIVYDPSCVTGPYSGKLLAEKVAKYVAANQEIIDDQFTKYESADFVAIRAHCLGMHSYVLGMGAPHNSVAVMAKNANLYRDEAVWRTVWTANHARNTFLFHRTNLSHFFNATDVMNEKKIRAKEAPEEYMPCALMKRPAYCAFTKEQRRRMIGVLTKCAFFTMSPEDISDIDLSNMVDEAAKQPGMAAKLSKAQSGAEQNDEREVGQVVKRTTFSDNRQRNEVPLEGQNLEGSDEEEDGSGSEYETDDGESSELSAESQAEVERQLERDRLAHEAKIKERRRKYQDEQKSVKGRGEKVRKGGTTKTVGFE